MRPAVFPAACRKPRLTGAIARRGETRVFRSSGLRAGDLVWRAGEVVAQNSFVVRAIAGTSFVIRGLDPPAGPKPLRRGEGPRIHQLRRTLWKRMDCRVKPGNDDRDVRILSAQPR